MSKVARSAEGNSRGNTIVLNRVKVIYQVFPGKKGTDAERAIADVDYQVMIGKAKASGKTAADGSVDLDIPANATAKLKIFDTDYNIKVVRAIEAETTKKGAKSRLTALGYELGAIDDTMNEDVDRTTSNFQADTDLNADGVTTGDFNTTTKNKLKSEFGE